MKYTVKIKVLMGIDRNSGVVTPIGREKVVSPALMQLRAKVIKLEFPAAVTASELVTESLKSIKGFTFTSTKLFNEAGEIANADTVESGEVTLECRFGLAVEPGDSHQPTMGMQPKTNQARLAKQESAEPTINANQRTARPTDERVKEAKAQWTEFLAKHKN